MQERNTQQYNKAIDALEQMLNQNSKNTKVSDKAMRGFHHILCESMKDAYADGMDGKTEPEIIKELRNTNTPFMKATAAVLLMAYADGSKARG